MKLTRKELRPAGEFLGEVDKRLPNQVGIVEDQEPVMSQLQGVNLTVFLDQLGAGDVRGVGAR